MKAMILAAGKGTRLKPLTDDRPKALVKVGGITLLERLLKKMKQSGIREVIINIHHYPCQIREFLEKNKSFGMQIAFSDESEELLDTGGGLVRASWFFRDGEPFLLHNVDVISAIDFQDMLSAHKAKGALATLAVSERETPRQLLANAEGIILGWKNEATGEEILAGDREKLHSLAFSGVHILSPEIFGLFRQTGSFSLIRAYLSIAGTGRILAYLHRPDHWFDLGKAEDLKDIESKIMRKEQNK